MKRWPNVHELAKATEDEVLKRVARTGVLLSGTKFAQSSTTDSKFRAFPTDLQGVNSG